MPIDTVRAKGLNGFSCRWDRSRRRLWTGYAKWHSGAVAVYVVRQRLAKRSVNVAAHIRDIILKDAFLQRESFAPYTQSVHLVPYGFGRRC